MKSHTKAAIVFSDIKEKITKGVLRDEDKLPPVRELAKEFDVSNFTIVEAFKRLEHEKLITRIQKSGVFILKNAVNHRGH